MGVCACGRITRIGGPWCQTCFMFWSAWWLRITDDEKGKNPCSCEDCTYRRRMQPLVDSAEKRNSASMR